MTLYFNPDGTGTWDVIHDDGQGNITTLASGVAREDVRQAAADAAVSEAQAGNTQLAVTIVADLAADNTITGSP